MPKTDGATLVLRETLLTVEKIGNQKTVALLRQIRMDSDNDASDVLTTHIIKTVCNKYSISKKHLLQEVHGDKRFDALCMCTFLFKEFLGFSNRKIAQALNRQSHKSVSHYVTRLNGLNPDHPVDKTFIAQRESLKAEIEKFKQALP